LAEQVGQRISNPSAEEIAALQPDLVIVPDWGNLSIVPSLRDIGLKVIVCKGAKNLDDIRDTVALLAQAVDEPERGDDLIGQMDAKLGEIKAKVDNIPAEQRKSVVLISLMKDYGGKGSSFDEACGLAGVVNGRAAAGIQDGQLMSKEQLVKIDPDVLFLPTYTNHGQYDVKPYRDSYLQDASLQTIKAIRTGNLQEPFEGYIYNCSQDFVFGVQEIAYCVYGDDFRQGRQEHLTAVEY
jgi:iron complex transport system substrate-binding protein